jgi:hypothetical protein
MDQIECFNGVKLLRRSGDELKRRTGFNCSVFFTKHLEYINTKVWVGPKFDPMLCDFNSIQKGLGKLKRLIHKYEEGFY